MLDAPSFLLVRVGDRIDPCEVSADIQASLTKHTTRACWIHAQHDLSIAFRLAVDLPDQPLLISTASGDWSAFENDRAWSQRTASSAFVVPSSALQHVPSQVSRLLGAPLLVRRNPDIEHDEEMRPLRRRAREILANCLGDNLAIRRSIAFDVGLDHTRIELSGPSIAAAIELIDEAVAQDQFDELVALLDRRYSRADTSELLREVRRLYQRLEG